MKIAIVGNSNLAYVLREVMRPHHEILSADRSDLIWLAEDMPLDEHDDARVNLIRDLLLQHLVPLAKPGAIILISTQIPVGFTRDLSKRVSQSPDRRKDIHFCYLPENIKIKNGISDWYHQDRFVIGFEYPECGICKDAIHGLLAIFEKPLYPMALESAEFVKHAVNIFLAMSIVFTNDLADLSVQVSADWQDIEKALRAEKRIGPHSYVRSGEPFTGGTLGRDLKYMLDIQARFHKKFDLFNAILSDNDVRLNTKSD